MGIYKMTGQLKKCKSCKALKQHADFSPLKTTSDGLHSYCKECRRKQARRKAEEKQVNQPIRHSGAYHLIRHNKTGSLYRVTGLQKSYLKGYTLLHENRIGYVLPKMFHDCPIAW